MSARTKSILVCFLAAALLSMTSPRSSHSQTSNTVGGGANGASVNVNASVLGVPASVTIPGIAPVTLPPEGGSFTNQVASASAQITPGVLPVIATSLIVNTTSGAITQTSAHSESSSTVNNLNLLGGLITAATIRSKSSSDGNGVSASSSAAGSFANQLRIGGVLYEQSEFSPNTTVSINASVVATVGALPVLVPLTGTVVINEQIGSGNGTTNSTLTVNFLHVNVSGSVNGAINLNANIIVASAASSVSFSGAGSGNHPPLLNLPAQQTVQVGSTLTFSASATDPDSGDSVTLTASNLPSGASASPNPASGNPASSQISFTPTQNQAGQSFTVNFSAVDSHGASTSGSVSISVTSPGSQNHPPVLSLPGPQNAQPGSTLTFSVTASDQDASDNVTLTASNLPQGATANPNPAGGNPAHTTVSFTPSEGQSGQSFAVNFTAVDSHGGSANGSVQISVGSVSQNHPPVISVPGPQVIAVAQTLTFTVAATDPDGDPVTLSATSVPAHAQFQAGTGRFDFTPTDDQAGTTPVVTFTATDSKGASNSATVQITVLAPGGGPQNPGPPIISVPPSPILVPVGTTVAFTVVGTSPAANCSVGVSTSDLPAHASFDASTGVFRFTPTADQQDDTFVVPFTATDCSGQTATASVMIVVVGGSVSGVEGPGRICLPITKIFFGATTVDQNCGFITVSLTNEGSGNLTIKSMVFDDGRHFRIEGVTGTPMVLKSAAVLQLKIIFEPHATGTLLDALTILTSDPDQPMITISLKGKGRNK